MPHIETRPGPVRPFHAHTNAQQSNVRVLILSPQPELRRSLRKALESLSMDVTLCSNCKQGEEVLSKQSFELVFCDSYLPDGSYADLIHPFHWAHKTPRVVVVVRKGERELHLDALKKGAFAVVEWPGYVTDVELAVLRAMREEERISLFRAVS
jgi:DNA-binding NtrC family response regulator